MDKLNGSIIKKQDISGTLALPFSTHMYSGEYIITPSIEGEVLETADKMLLEDVTIKPIPYAEVDNPSGGTTVNIAFIE